MPTGRNLAKKPVRVAKDLAKKVIGLLPPASSRLTGRLAKEGGKPVRDMRFRPWGWYPSSTAFEWMSEVAPVMRRIFNTGEEGLPQKLGIEFAEKWAEYCGTRYALLLPHGTDALRIAMAAALDHDGLDYGGEIIVPNLTFIASATSALDRRFGIALVDVDPETLNIDPARVEEAIIPGKTRAIMAVHLFGQPADMTRLKEVAARHSLRLIEDAAQAHGALHELGHIGSLGDAAAFSFQSSKNLSSGEGGALTTNNPEIFERAYEIHNVGRTRVGGQRWGHATLGWNCRPSEYVAAVLLHRMRTIEKEQQRRYARFLSLRERIADLDCIEPLALGPGVQRHASYMFVMRYRPEYCGGLELDAFLKAINAEGIPTYRAYETTLAQQPALQRLRQKHPDYIRVLPTPAADQAVKEIIYLPHPLLLGSENDMAEIAAAFRKVQARYNEAGVRKQITAPVKTADPVVSAHVSRPAAKSKAVRFGIIGIGLMGQQHAAAIGRSDCGSLVAVTDAQSEAGRQMASKLDCKWFSNAEELIHSDAIDAVIIATPHWQHAKLAVSALRAGLHLICEKPITVTVADADDILRTAAESPGKFAAVHQTRFEPAYQYAKTLLDSGELGAIYRCSMVESMWRTQAYYKSSPWRGTWEGEGGGVLLNQAPHLLDRYAWLCGMPESLSANCDTTLHQIEVEDTASAILRHQNGAHGYIHINTIESPAISRTVISCDRGRIVIENGAVRLTRLRDSIQDKTAHDTRPMGNLESETYDMSPGQLSFQELLDAFYRNFLAATKGEEALVCPGEEGRNAVELANAMILSSISGKAISIPLSRTEYTQFIQKMISSRAKVG